MTKKFIFINIEESNRKYFQNLLYSSDFVLLLGSAISLWQPSNVPTGQSIRDAICEYLDFKEVFLSTEKNYLRNLKEILNKFPFELLMDRCPNRKGVKDILFDFYKNFNSPNPVHNKIAEMFNNSRVSAIITPNYDVCLENAIVDTHPISNFSKVSLEKDIQNRSLEKIIFKIHGSVDSNEKDSLIFMMQQEGRLPYWKHFLFRDLIKNKNLLIIGYSGYDFDICPEIPLAMPNKIYWNYLSKKNINDNTREVAKKVNTEFLIGDMRKLLTFLGYPVIADYGKDYQIKIDDFISNISFKVSNLSKKLWRLKILNSISFNEIVIRESEELINQAPTPSFLIETLSEKATALSNSGRYRQAALIYEKAAKISRKNGLKRDFSVKSELAAHSWLTYGNLYRFWIWNILAKITKPRVKENYGINSNELQFIRDLYRGLMKWKLIFPANILRKYAKSKIENLGPEVHKQGNWHGINRLQILASDFDINLNEIKIIGEYDLKPINLGYSQVSMPIGQMMAYRKSIEKKEINVSKKSHKDGEKLLRQAIRLGINAEVWKLSILLDSVFNLVNNHTKEFWLGFNNCEYSKNMRKYHYINASGKVNYL